MNTTLDHRGGLSLSDLFIICWLVIATIFFADWLIGGWSEKSEYAIVELFLLLNVSIYLRLRNQNIEKYYRWNPVPLKTLAPFLLIAFGGSVILDALDRFIGLAMPMPEDSFIRLTAELTPNSSWELFLLFIGLGLMAPIAEESIFRGAIQKILEDRGDLTGAILITAGLFAILHFQYWWLIQLLIMAAYLGYLAWRWNSIIPAVILHSANNVLSFFLTGNLIPEWRNWYLLGNQVNPVLTLLALASIVAGHRWVERIRRG